MAHSIKVAIVRPKFTLFAVLLPVGIFLNHTIYMVCIQAKRQRIEDITCKADRLLCIYTSLKVKITHFISKINTNIFVGNQILNGKYTF